MVINEKALAAVPASEVRKVYTMLFPKAAQEAAEGREINGAYKVAWKVEKELKRRNKSLK